MIRSAALYIKHHPHADLAVPKRGLLSSCPDRSLSAGYEIAVLDHACSTNSALSTYQPAAFFPRSNRRWGGDDEYILKFKPGAQVRRCPWLQQRQQPAMLPQRGACHSALHLVPPCALLASRACSSGQGMALISHTMPAHPRHAHTPCAAECAEAPSP